jgi:hypothetical protein
MDKSEDQKKTVLVQAWEDWDDEKVSPTSAPGPRLCKIDDPDCEACQ